MGAYGFWGDGGWLKVGKEAGLAGHAKPGVSSIRRRLRRGYG
jgi:hypothetical protein